jgi:hypothetical protein
MIYGPKAENIYNLVLYRNILIYGPQFPGLLTLPYPFYNHSHPFPIRINCFTALRYRSSPSLYYKTSLSPTVTQWPLLISSLTYYMLHNEHWIHGTKRTQTIHVISITFDWIMANPLVLFYLPTQERQAILGAGSSPFTSSTLQFMAKIFCCIFYSFTVEWHSESALVFWISLWKSRFLRTQDLLGSLTTCITPST